MAGQSKGIFTLLTYLKLVWAPDVALNIVVGPKTIVTTLGARTVPAICSAVVAPLGLVVVSEIIMVQLAVWHALRDGLSGIIFSL
jgi:hypothetical protein